LLRFGDVAVNCTWPAADPGLGTEIVDGEAQEASMAHASVLPELEPAPPPIVKAAPSRAPAKEPEFLFQSLVVTEPEHTAARSGTTFSVSLILHALLIVAVVILPLLWYDTVPLTNARTLRTFFAEIPNVPAPPPPPPPPAPAVALRRVAPVSEPMPPVEAAAFIAPIEVPDQIVEEKTAFGFDEGVPGGVEGGVPGGVVGGVVGGLPQEAASSESAPIVRVGGSVAAPKLIHSVRPEYPELAQMARLSGIVILEALVDAKGRVESVTVLRGAALLDEAAVEAVKQWRYKPLLLNGVPTRFFLTVTVKFNFTESGP
jgi:protein TonB